MNDACNYLVPDTTKSRLWQRNVRIVREFNPFLNIIALTDKSWDEHRQELVSAISELRELLDSIKIEKIKFEDLKNYPVEIASEELNKFCSHQNEEDEFLPF